MPELNWKGPKPSADPGMLPRPRPRNMPPINRRAAAAMRPGPNRRAICPKLRQADRFPGSRRTHAARPLAPSQSSPAQGNCLADGRDRHAGPGRPGWAGCGRGQESLAGLRDSGYHRCIAMRGGGDAYPSGTHVLDSNDRACFRLCRGSRCIRTRPAIATERFLGRARRHGRQQRQRGWPQQWRRQWRFQRRQQRRRQR